MFLIISLLETSWQKGSKKRKKLMHQPDNISSAQLLQLRSTEIPSKNVSFSVSVERGCKKRAILIHPPWSEF